LGKGDKDMSVHEVGSTGNGSVPYSSTLPNKLGLTNQKSTESAAEKKLQKEVTPDVLQKAIDEANEVLGQVRPDLKFVVDNETNEVVVMFVSPDTGDIVNRYPTERAIAISHEIVKSQEQRLQLDKDYQRKTDELLGLFVKQRI
jgi:uncharacterized FlaG/YvyC family protein